MRRDLAHWGVARQARRPATSIACLAFVALLATAFWAGVVWIAQAFMALGTLGF
ncbi:hypothetical protein ACO2Q0_17520 [Phenylobacterium sp. VNQ135]|uniref:hypothetical protein n=1 Tax=Phenylobacterium sp. VNQ135 TaxID=3400922 RepID=UPI003C07FE82